MIAILAATALLTCTSPGVVDGDTLRCKGERIRIWGIQAPERSDPGGPASTRALAALTTGRTVECRRPPSGQVRDRYRRLVAQCFANGRDVAADMVRQGQAKDWPRYSHGYYARRR